MLGSCAKSWEVCCSFMHKFPSGARCLAGQSGFQAALGGGLLRQFFCLPFPGIFPEWGGNSFAFVKFPLSVRLLRKDFLRSCVPNPLIFQVNRIGSCVIVPFSDYVQKGSRVLSG